MSQDAQHLLERFWAGIATTAERQQLADLFGPGEAAWQAQLRAEYEQMPTAADGPLTAEQSARVLRRLHWQLALPAAPAAKSRRPGWVRWAAAASVLLAVGLLALLGYRRVGVAPMARVQPPAPAARPVGRTNTGTEPLAVALPDGSVATLQPGAAISYYLPFGAGGRDLRLQGAALFAVAKDARHPFTVLANGFTTTALGTKFRVRATEAHRVVVRLLEGRVVVRATPALHLAMRDQYLTPGQELRVNTDTRQVRLSRVAPAPAPAHPLAVDVPAGLSFEKDRLRDVLAQVGTRYHVRIAYDTALVRGLSFTGSFEATDPLPVVLRAVCAPNGLAFTQTPGRVTIRKLL